ncbi:PD-(D/E)XK nuclease family transposase [Fibrobacter sp.]|uniref:PD-(D/E)XK nuclease family transposase n=1 Tax=Fibrobacter sp. TaxID=35828 RepID=UPI00388E2DEB
MNKSQFWAMACDLKEHPENLPKYRAIYRNVYPFSDGIFKMLMANEGKPERTIKFLNAMLGLTGDKAITEFTLGVQEQPGVLDNKTNIFDIYGYNQAKEPVVIEVQQNFNTLFVDRLVYYTARIVNNQVKKSKSYELPHIYVLSLLVDDQFPLEADTYFHHCQVMRNRKYPFKKIDVFLVEMTKFFRMDDRLLEENRKAARSIQEGAQNEHGIARDMSPRAEMLRLFRDVLEDKTIDMEKAGKLLDEDFVKDVDFKGYTDELLLLEVDNMTDMLYEKQGSYLQGKAEGREEGHAEGADAKNKELAKGFRDDGFPLEAIAKRTGLSPEEIQAL